MTTEIAAPAMPSQERTTHPAAAGGDPGRQLRHLRGHREFQRQGIFTLLEIDWCTKITREQSRLHIIRHLHAKGDTEINAKGEARSGGKLDTHDARKDSRKIRQDHKKPGAGGALRVRQPSALEAEVQNGQVIPPAP